MALVSCLLPCVVCSRIHKCNTVVCVLTVLSGVTAVEKRSSTDVLEIFDG